MTMESMNRRSFLKRTALFAGAPWIVPASALGRTGAGANDRIHIGIIGTGERGRSHITDLYDFGDQARITALCDVNLESRRKAKDLLGKMKREEGVVCYGDFRELLADSDIDAVIIAVPEHWHAPIAIAAAKAKKHLYLEKPFAYSVVEGRAIVQAVKENGVVFQHGTQQRSMPQYRLACELALNGRLGNLHTIKVGSPDGKVGGDPRPAPAPAGLDYEFWLGPAPWREYTPGRCDGAGGNGWYLIRDYSGGWITGWGSHDVDIAQWGNGSDTSGPVSIEARAEFPTEGLYNTVLCWHAECLYANGRKLVYTSAAENPHGVRFEGDRGWVFVNREVIKADPEGLLKESFGDKDIRVKVSDSHLGNFLETIRKGGETVAPVETAHRSTALCHLINIAIARGKKLDWDPTAEQFTNDEAANRLLFRPLRAPWTLG